MSLDNPPLDTCAKVDDVGTSLAYEQKEETQKDRPFFSAPVTKNPFG